MTELKNTDIKTLNINDIMKYLPHRYPFLLIDKVIDLVPDESCTAIKCVTINEEFFNGHFPGMPVMPGVLQLEAIAQTCILTKKPFLDDQEKYVFLFTGIDNVKFKRQVLPGDVLTIKVKKTASKGPITKCHGEITVDGQIIVEADVSAYMQDTSKSK